MQFEQSSPNNETLAQPRLWSDIFIDYFRSRVHGTNYEILAQSKPEVAVMAEHFGGEHMPNDALEVARIAHIAELTYHLNLRPNIVRGLSEAFGETVQNIPPEEWAVDAEHTPLKYTFGLIKDFPIIADFIKKHEQHCKQQGHEYVDIEGLVELVEKVNFESIIIKSALDYSNFLFLDQKTTLTDQEMAKMERTVTAIKTVDSPLLALTGLDALEAEILSKAYCWELQRSGNGLFVQQADDAFEALGGRQKLAQAAESFLEELFSADDFSHDRVTPDQDTYGTFFTDGIVDMPETIGDVRVLARLKSVGSTAKKMHALHEKTGTLEIPMDIMGVTLIAKDKEHMKECLEATIARLTALGVTFKSAPSRQEQVHVKGRPDFLEIFGVDSESSDLYNRLSMQVKDEPCDNGYEAVKITMAYSSYGIEIPVEIQFTHETARKESRVGLGSHTLFKLMKLAKDAAHMSISQLSTEELLERFKRINLRKSKFDKSSYETNSNSNTRAGHLYDELLGRQESKRKSVGAIAIRG
jgi:hypothetical protein